MVQYKWDISLRDTFSHIKCDTALGFVNFLTNLITCNSGPVRGRSFDLWATVLGNLYSYCGQNSDANSTFPLRAVYSDHSTWTERVRLWEETCINIQCCWPDRILTADIPLASDGQQHCLHQWHSNYTIYWYFTSLQLPVHKTSHKGLIKHQTI